MSSGSTTGGASSSTTATPSSRLTVPFFFEGAPAATGIRQAAKGTAEAPSPTASMKLRSRSSSRPLAETAFASCRTSPL